MATNFLEAAGTIGYLSPTKGSGTGNIHTTTTVDNLSFNPQTSNNGGAAIVGSLVTIGSGGHAPDILAAVASSSSITLLTATSSTVSGTAVSIYNYPVLISGEASALANGGAVLSSYWNSNGIVRQSDMQQGLQADLWFVAGGALTPSVGGYLAGWFLPSFDGGSTFESDNIATPSSTVPALSRAPDFIVPLDNAAYAAGNIRYCQGRYIAAPPPTSFKTKLQNMSGVAMPSTWAIVAAPWAVQY